MIPNDEYLSSEQLKKLGDIRDGYGQAFRAIFEDEKKARITAEENLRAAQWLAAGLTEKAKLLENQIKILTEQIHTIHSKQLNCKCGLQKAIDDSDFNSGMAP